MSSVPCMYTPAVCVSVYARPTANQSITPTKILPYAHNPSLLLPPSLTPPTNTNGYWMSPDGKLIPRNDGGKHTCQEPATRPHRLITCVCACMRLCVCSCERETVRACVRACMHACMLQDMPSSGRCRCTHDARTHARMQRGRRPIAGDKGMAEPPLLHRAPLGVDGHFFRSAFGRRGPCHWHSTTQPHRETMLRLHPRERPALRPRVPSDVSARLVVQRLRVRTASRILSRPVASRSHAGLRRCMRYAR